MKKQKENITTATNFLKNEECVCPICAAEDLEYGDTEIECGSLGYKWECESCKTEGTEWYDLKVSTHGNVVNKDGNEIENKEGY